MAGSWRYANSSTVDEVCLDIVRYLVSHSEAADTTRGIAEWWIKRDMAKTAQAVTKLPGAGGWFALYLVQDATSVYAFTKNLLLRETPSAVRRSWCRRRHLGCAANAEDLRALRPVAAALPDRCEAATVFGSVFIGLALPLVGIPAVRPAWSSAIPPATVLTMLLLATIHVAGLYDMRQVPGAGSSS
jgi:hypothetical protein